MDSLYELLDKYKLPLGLSLVGLVLIIGGLFSSGLVENYQNTSKKVASSFPKESIVQASQLKVDVSGAVNKPGVYSLSSNSRIEDVIKAAGGFSASSSAEYIAKNLNLSQKVADGQKVYIPFEGETYASSQVAGAQVGSKIGINSGSMSELESLPGVGPATATKIVNLRPYNEVSELLSKKAISKSVYEKIKDLVDLH